MDFFLEIGLVLGIIILFSIISLKKKSLDKKGVIIGIIIGLLFYLLGSFKHFLVVVLFFVVADISTRISRKNRAVSHEQRTTGNIIGNSSAAFIALIANIDIAFFGAMAAALADTLSSEIGLLSKKKPRLITNLKEVSPGTDGGVTTLGLLASIAGALIIGGIHFYWYSNPLSILIILCSGFVGSLVDSFFGATLELKGKLNNTEVNFLGSFSGAITAFVLFLLL